MGACRTERSSRALAGCSALYDAEITATDAAVGRLLDGLKQRGRANPLIAFTADHGENMGEWGLFFEHGPNVHDASLRVPLVLAGPGVPPARSEAVARVEDIAPTLEAILGLSSTERLPSDGDDLSARWKHTATKPEIAFAESGSALHARLTDYLVSGRKQRLHCINGPQLSLCRTGKGKEGDAIGVGKQEDRGEEEKKERVRKPTWGVEKVATSCRPRRGFEVAIDVSENDTNGAIGEGPS